MEIIRPAQTPADEKADEARNSQVEVTEARLEYLAIMCDVEIPEDDDQQPEEGE